MAIDEPVFCPRCGYDLRQQVAACDRTSVSGVDCPECGITLDVEELTSHEAHPWLFEYRWRDRPLRRCLMTFVRSLEPRSFWRAVRLTDRTFLLPPAIVYLTAVLLLAAFLLVSRVVHTRAWAGRGRIVVFDRAVLSSDRVDWTEQIALFLRLDAGRLAIALLVATALPVALLLSARLVWGVRIRPAHVVRIWFYSLILPTTVMLLWALVYAAGLWFPAVELRAADYWSLGRLIPKEPSRFLWATRELLPTAVLVLGLVLWFGLWWSIASRRYMRLPRSARGIDAFAVASIVVLLAVAAVVEFWLRNPLWLTGRPSPYE